ncbi:MAG TPA: hypothetical protein PLS12_05980 [Bacteroidales bacterium]|nr:hypothetical protein [Bacteroidales bacterium]
MIAQNIIIAHESLLEYPKTVLQYTKFECGISIPDTVQQQINEFFSDSNSINPAYALTSYKGINPYNAHDISVEIVFTHQSSVQIKRYGFYYQNYSYTNDSLQWIPIGNPKFLVRFSTDLIGLWTAKVIMKIQSMQMQIEFIAFSFVCLPNETSPGYIIAKKNNAYLEYTNTNKTMVLIGLNIPHPQIVPRSSPLFNNYSVTHYKQYFKYFVQAAGAHCNFIRVALVGSYTSAPEFDKILNYNQRQPYMFEFDTLLHFAEKNNIYFQIIGDSFGPYVISWDLNPYQYISGIRNPLDVFTSDVAREIYKQRIRYIYSRWGYSTSFCMYQIINEIDQIVYKNQKLSSEIIYNWVSDIANYITEDLQYPIIVTTNFAGFDSFPYVFALDNIDVTTIHYYGKNRNHDLVALYSRVQNEWNLFKKPVIIDETGGNDSYGNIDAQSDLLYKNRLFSTVFSGGAGAAVQYYWNVYMSQEGDVRSSYVWYNKLLNDYLNILDSLHIYNYNYLQFSPQRFPQFESKELYNVPLYDTLFSLVEQFALCDSSKQIILGWVHNRSHYWANEVSDSLLYPKDDDYTKKPILIDYKNPNVLVGEYVIMYDLLPSMSYEISWYSTRKSQEKITKINEGILQFTTNSEGVSQKIYPPFSAEEFDFLFIAKKIE